MTHRHFLKINASSSIECSTKTFQKLIDSLQLHSIDWNEISLLLKEITMNIHHLIFYYPSEEMKIHYKQFISLSKDLSTESYSDTILIHKNHVTNDIQYSNSLPSQLHYQLSFLNERF